MKKQSSVNWGCWIAVAAFACLLGAAVISGGVLLYAFWEPAPVNLTVSVSNPGQIRVNETFSMRVSVTNQDAQPVTISEIRLPLSISEVAEVVDVTPSFQGLILSEGGAICKFNQRIEPGATVVFSMNMRARMDGEVTGTIDVVASGQSTGGDAKWNVISATSTPRANPPAAITATPFPADLRPFKSVALLVAYVDVGGSEPKPYWWGSGTVLTADGYLLTNYHVAVGMEERVEWLEVYFTDSPDSPPKPRYFAEVVKSSEKLDLAVVKIVEDKRHREIDPAELNLTPVPLGDSDLLSIGDHLIVIGYPGIGGNTITMTEGIVSGFTAESGFGSRAWVKTDATIAGGNSGGLAINTRGELVGVPTLLGSGGDAPITDCRQVADTNGDGLIDEKDSCIPTGGYINALRPINLAYELIEEATSLSVESLQNPEPVTGPDVPEVLFWDDFSEPFVGWDLPDTDIVRAWFSEEALHFWQKEESGRTILRPHLWLRNIQAEIDVMLSQSSGPGGFGLVCRYRSDSDYYFFQMDESGNAAIGKIMEGEQALLIRTSGVEGWKGVGELHRLRADCVGSSLALYLDGNLVLEAEDDVLATGDMGIFLGPLTASEAELVFDNLLVYKR